MKRFFKTVFENEIFHLFINMVIVETAILAVVLSVLQEPPEMILATGLKDIILIFEG